MNKLTFLSSSIILGLLSHQAVADQQSPIEDFYLGAKAGYSVLDAACSGLSTSCDDDDFAYGLFGGYNFNENFAIELDITDYNRYSTKIGSDYINTHYAGYGTSLRYNHEIVQDLDWFARAGATYVDVNQTSSLPLRNRNGFKATLATGLAYDITPSWKVQAEYQFMNNVVNDNAHFVSIGVSYRFGQHSHPAPVIAPVVVPVKPLPVVEVVEPVPVKTPEPLTLYFEHDSYKLSEANKSMLRNVALDIDEVQTIVLEVEGYTSSVGSEDYNQKLSVERGNAVRDYLVIQGIEKERISVVGYGETKLIPNVPHEMNRRVYIKFVDHK